MSGAHPSSRRCIQNLGTIRIGENLERPGGHTKPSHLVFPDYDVKNNQALEFPLSPSTTALIDDYVAIHRPILMRGHNPDFLFPGDEGGAKGVKTLGEQISKRISAAIGLKVTPHQFRHAAAVIVLRAEPGNYELVRRLLGHKSLATTTRFYIGLESLEATVRFGEIVTDMTPQKGMAMPARASGWWR